METPTKNEMSPTTAMRYTNYMGTRLLKSETEGKSQTEIETMVYAKWEKTRKDDYNRQITWQPGPAKIAMMLEEDDHTLDSKVKAQKSLLLSRLKNKMKSAVDSKIVNDIYLNGLVKDRKITELELKVIRKYSGKYAVKPKSEEQFAE